MARNGSGTYSKPSGTTFVNGTLADADDVNELADDIATALTGSVAKNGETAMTGNLAMGSNKLTGLAAGSGAGDSLRYEQLVGGAIAPLSVTIDGSLQPKYDYWILCASDESTNITTGTAKVSFHAPYAATLVAVKASLSVAQAAGSIIAVDVNEAGVSVLSTTITIDNNELTSSSAATPPVISDSAIAANALLTVDIDTVGTALAKGLKVTLTVSAA